MSFPRGFLLGKKVFQVECPGGREDGGGCMEPWLDIFAFPSTLHSLHIRLDNEWIPDRALCFPIRR